MVPGNKQNQVLISDLLNLEMEHRVLLCDAV